MIKFRANIARGFLILAGISFLFASALACMAGDPCYLFGYGLTFLLALPAIFYAGIIARIVAILIAVLSLWGFSQNLLIALDPVRNPKVRVHLIRSLASGKQLVPVFETGGYPGDLPVKTDQEYLEYLVRNHYLSESDLAMLSYRYRSAVTLAELSGDTIAFTIYRVSKDDPPDTVFLILKSRFDRKGCVVIRKDGGGDMGLRSVLESAAQFPPRQPQALEAVPPVAP